VEDARAAHALFRERLPYALTAEGRRDEITLVVEELDDGAFDDWLVPMLRALPRRGFTLTLHVEGERPGPFEAWPRERRWGPPRDPDAILDALAKPKRSMRCLVVRCRGPYAGSFLALESGLHRTARAPKGKRGGEPQRLHVFVRVASFAFAVKDDAWNEADALAPPEGSSAPLRRRAAPARERVAGQVIFPGKRAKLDVAPEDYWARLDEIALTHLLLFEQAEDGLDRAEVFGDGEGGAS
jgi:ATP-dependent Clp protease ATP-binding subunit ClpC